MRHERLLALGYFWASAPRAGQTPALGPGSESKTEMEPEQSVVYEEMNSGTNEQPSTPIITSWSLEGLNEASLVDIELRYKRPHKVIRAALGLQTDISISHINENAKMRENQRKEKKLAEGNPTHPTGRSFYLTKNTRN